MYGLAVSHDGREVAWTWLKVIATREFFFGQVQGVWTRGGGGKRENLVEKSVLVLTVLELVMLVNNPIFFFFKKKKMNNRSFGIRLAGIFSL